MADESAPRRILRARSPAPGVTEAVGQALGRALGPGSVLALIGELGAGKTCLVRGLARGLDIESGVASPTFTRMVEHPGRLPLYHFDAWRAGSRELLADAGEYLCGPGVAVVEWADRVAEFLPRPHLALVLEHEQPEVRALELLLVPAAERGAEAHQRRLEAAARAVREVPGLEIVDGP